MWSGFFASSHPCWLSQDNIKVCSQTLASSPVWHLIVLSVFLSACHSTVLSIRQTEKRNDRMIVCLLFCQCLVLYLSFYNSVCCSIILLVLSICLSVFLSFCLPFCLSFWGAFPEQQRNLRINHHSTMHCCGNELASHDCFPNMVASPSFEPHSFNDIGPLLMMSHACGVVITSAI